MDFESMHNERQKKATVKATIICFPEAAVAFCVSGYAFPVHDILSVAVVFV